MEMASHYFNSYRDLPASVYQFQTKLRNELRTKAGIMRGREFLMKDMYSLHTSSKDLDEYYTRATEAYKRIYDRLGIGDDTFVTFAGGGAFTKFSHEFQTICKVGEDWLYLDRDTRIAINEEALDDAVKELKIDISSLEKVRSAEVGNIFNFGDEKAKQMGIYFMDEKGQRQPIYLASYGIGVTRVMGVIAEKMSDEKGLVWPENIAPARVYLVRIGDTPEVTDVADALYDALTKKGIEILYDDRDMRPGEKFNDADLIGIPHRVVVSERNAKEGKFEYKKRTDDESEYLTRQELFDKLFAHTDF
jgi:prolyl-tRNA synthetase